MIQIQELIKHFVLGIASLIICSIAMADIGKTKEFMKNPVKILVQNEDQTISSIYDQFGRSRHITCTGFLERNEICCRIRPLPSPRLLVVLHCSLVIITPVGAHVSDARATVNINRVVLRESNIQEPFRTHSA